MEMTRRSRARRPSSRSTGAQLVAALDSALGELEHCRRILTRHRRRHLDQQLRGATSPSTEATSSDGDGRAGKGDDLIEGALRVAHAALADLAISITAASSPAGDLLGRGDRLELLGDLLDADRLQLERLRA